MSNTQPRCEHCGQFESPSNRHIECQARADKEAAGVS